jgi:hypothetical protein
MTTRVQCGVTAGLAIVGASVMAVAPLTLPMASQSAPVTAEVELTATPMEQAAILIGGLAESGIRAGSGAALTPLSPVLAGTALAFGDNQRAYSIIRQSIDAPLWAADPTINALAAVLPAPVGGGVADNTPGANDGALVNFRDDVLWAATNAIRTPIRDALGAVEPPANQNYAAAVGAGLLASGERFVTSTAGAPLGLIPIAQAIASGSEAELYVAIRQYIDAPLYIADPTINALAGALPAPLGGGTADNQGNQQGDGAVVQFRDNVLFEATRATRTPIANLLGVDPNLNSVPAAASASKVTNTDVLGAAKVAKNGTSTAEEIVAGSGGGSGATTGAGATANNRPISTAVKAINNQLKQSAEQLNKTVKHIAGADKEKKDAANND